MERKLAAILSADVQGYSRLMAEDEEATIATLTLYRRVMTSLVNQHRGRVVDSPGDNLLAEFGSVVDAVQGAVAIQMELNARNIELEPHPRMDFRIGINLGDVVVDGDQIYGDGVNIAARVQSLADAGGICISGTVHEHIKNKLPLGYVSLGEQAVKNIAEPIRIYRVLGQADIASTQADPGRSAAELADPRAPTASAVPISTLALVLTAGVALAVFVIGLLFFVATPDRGSGSMPKAGGGGAQVASRGPNQGVDASLEQAAPVESRRVEVDPLEARSAAVGVMNFKALLPDPESSWMQQAIRDNLNGQLNKVSGLEVFSKEYIDFLVEEGDSEIKVANDLGISRMISGSYLVKGDKLRIEAHVVNIETGLLEVSDSVEGAQADFFMLQSELAFKIAGHLDFALSPEDRTAIASAPSAPRLDAYRLLLEAEGETAQGESPMEDHDPELPESSRADEVNTERPGFLQRGWLGPRAAWADEAVPAEAEIREVLERYRRAYETKDLDMLRSVYAHLTPKQREAREKYFQNTQDLEVEIEKVQIAVRDDDAVVSYTREDRFTDSQTGETVKLDVRLTKRLRRVDGDWKMVGRKK